MNDIRKHIKTIFALILVLALTFAFTACGGGTTPSDEPEDIGALEFEFNKIDIPEDAAQKAVITCTNAENGETVWEYETEKCYVAELDTLQDIGGTVNGYMFIADGTVYCLNPVTGEVDWKNEEFGGASASWTFGDDGKIYLCGYYGPDLFIINPDGSTAKSYEAFGEEGEMTEGCFHASSIRFADDGNILIKYDNNGKTLKVDPETGDWLDVYPYTTAISKEDLVGYWTNDTETRDIVFEIGEDLSYTAYCFGEGGETYHYYGRIELSEYSEISEGYDFMSFLLDDTDDPALDGWDNMGDYIIEFTVPDAEEKWLNLVQENNGDSIFSIHFDTFWPIIYKVELDSIDKAA